MVASSRAHGDRLPQEATRVDRMRRKLQTKAGAAIYSRRKTIVEPVFGQIKQARGFRQFLLRGLEKVQGEWAVICLTHNILKLQRLCLEQLCELADLMPDEVYGMNPIALYERMTNQDSIAYCPFAYTYSNYSRDGFGKRHLRFSSPVALDHTTPMRTVLGGTGIAISAGCKDIPLALDYSLFVAGRSCQRTLYGMCGGQPARRSAWHDALLNQITDDFFSQTIASIETAYVRPRYRGYVGLQESAGKAISEYCKHRGNPRQTLDQIDLLYRASLKGDTPHA